MHARGGRGVGRSVNTLGTRRDPPKVLDIPKTFRRVGVSGGTRWNPASGRLEDDGLYEEVDDSFVGR